MTALTETRNPLLTALGAGNPVMFGCILTLGALWAGPLELPATSGRVAFIRDSMATGGDSAVFQGLQLNLPAEQAATTLLVSVPEEIRTENYTSWVHLPDWTEPERQPSPDLLLKQLKQMACLSDRDLGELIGVSHPTVASLLHGKVSARSRDAIARIPALYNVLQRLAPLASSPQALRASLDVAEEGGETTRSLLSSQRYSEAYGVGLAALRPRPVGRLLDSRPSVAVRLGTVDPTRQSIEGD